MDFAQSYRRSIVPFSKSASSSILKEFESFYKWEETCTDEERTALDVGCGEGSVTTEVIKPFLPASTRLDAADKSEDMIRFARHCYEEQGYKFFLWNVEEKILDEKLLKSYDHVFSFFCFHHVGNPMQALKNIYDILKPNGNFIFAFMPRLPYYKALKAMSHNPKWSSYMQDFDKLCPLPFAEEESPHKIFAQLMSECGFRNVITKPDVKYMLFHLLDAIEGQARYVDPFHKRMPPGLQEEYLAEFINALKQIEGFWMEKYDDNGKCKGAVKTYELLIGYGEKGSK